MRGNWQGNNAFMEEPTWDYKTIGELMDQDEWMAVWVGYLNPIPMNSLILISRMSWHAVKFFKAVWYHALRIGDLESAAFMLEFIKEYDKEDDIKDSISDECLSILWAKKDHCIRFETLNPTWKLKKIRYGHLLAINEFTFDLLKEYLL